MLDIEQDRGMLGIYRVAHKNAPCSEAYNLHWQ